MLLTCKGWNATLTAAPRFMPTAVIKGFNAIAPWIDHVPEYSSHNALAVQQAAHRVKGSLNPAGGGHMP